jgi:peroxiredoxin
MCHLQKLYAKYADRGLVVLGVNVSDNEKIAREMLEQNGVEFPSILDTSAEADKAMEEYETFHGWTAVPMTYVINREGKVVDAWYGFSEKRMKKALKKLKLYEEKQTPGSNQADSRQPAIP